jgi:hypothetical protein
MILEKVLSADFLQSLFIAIIVSYSAWKELREKRLSKKYNLPGNPGRCMDNLNRIIRLEDKIDELNADIAGVQATVDALHHRLSRIENKI